MAKSENFYLETGGGAYVLRIMAKDIVHNSAQKIASAAAKMSGASSGHKARLKVVGTIEGIGGKPDAQRYTATIVAEDSETEAQLRRGGYVQKSINAGRVR